MQIETKYNHGEEVRYKKVIQYGNKKTETEIYVGIIDSIHLYAPKSTHVEAGNISYSMKNHGGHVKEQDIICKLVEAK